MSSEMNAYELERAARIESNKERMRALGLGQGGAYRVGGVESCEAVHHVDASGVQPMGSKPRKAKASSGKRLREPAPPARASRRLRGIDTDGEQTNVPVPKLSYADKDESQIKRRGLAFPDPSNFFASEIAVPFTLRSISVTVHSLGQVHRGAFKQRYWSSTGCLYHHAYPVGYVATKHHFNNHYQMTIEAGEVGPVFRVTNTATGRTFTGPSPTKPWTAVCESIRTKTRISGPLFFGFSDPITMRSLAQQYDADEIRACVTGDKVELLSDALPSNDLERVVTELRANVNGLGEHVAIAIARTNELSRLVDVSTDGQTREPRRLQSLEEVVKCVSTDGGRAMKTFLETNELIAESARRWPAWRTRVVPRIINSLLEGTAGDGKESNACGQTDSKEVNEVKSVALPTVEKTNAEKPWTATICRNSLTPGKSNTVVDLENIPPSDNDVVV